MSKRIVSRLVQADYNSSSVMNTFQSFYSVSLKFSGDYADYSGIYASDNFNNYNNYSDDSVEGTASCTDSGVSLSFVGHSGGTVTIPFAALTYCECA